MNQLLKWLSAGDLRSDGLANQVVNVVIQQPDLIAELVEGLDHPDDPIRGHTADALEKIARSHPELVLPYLTTLISSSCEDPVPMVKMHLAMTFGHLAMYLEQAEELISALLVLLDDQSVFTVSWAIASLCIFGRRFPDKRDPILERIASLQNHNSIAIRSRVGKAIRILTDDDASFPKGWIKSEHLGAS